MKYLSSLMGLGLLVLSLGTTTSCSRENGKTLIIDKPIAPSGSEAYLRLAVNRPNDVTLRSLTSEPMKDIKTLLLLFYSTDHQTLQNIKEFSITSADQLNNLVVRLEAKDYKLVALANPSSKIRGLINIGSPLSNLTSAQALVADDFLDPETKLMLMGNEQGAITIPSSSFKSDASSLSESITLSLEPSLARILVYGEPTLRAGSKGTAPAKYLVTNIQKQAYVLRQLNLLSDGTEEQANDRSARNLRYAKTPTWLTWQQTPPSHSDAVGAFSAAQSTAANMEAPILASAEAFASQLKDNTTLYSKESTMPDNSYFLSTVPCAVIAYPYIPKGLSLTSNEGFISYQGRYYSESEVKKMIQTSDRSKDPQLMEAIRLNNINESSFSNTQGFDKGGIKFYYQGYSYYSVFIKHFGDPNKRYGFYGLVRGNEYHIRLLKINDPGSPTPLVYTNNMNPISEEQSSALKLQVSTLNVRNQDVEL